MARPIIIPLAAGLLLTTSCGLLADAIPSGDDDMCCRNPPPPEWLSPQFVWDASTPPAAAGPVVATGEGGERVVVTPAAVGQVGTVALIERDGTKRWERPLPEFRRVGRPTIDGRVIRIVAWDPTAFGGTVARLDPKTGEPMWTKPLSGLGAVAHAEYDNAIQVEIMDGMLVVRGNEAAGRYVEVWNDDGHQNVHRLITDEVAPTAPAAPRVP